MHINENGLTLRTHPVWNGSREWSRMNIYNTFVIADTHFNHPRMFQYRRRAMFGGHDGQTVETMNEMLIDNWNSVVGPKDHVVVMGDFTWKGTDAEGLLTALHGRKMLAIGNHDVPKTRKCPLWKHTGDIISLHVGEESDVPKEERITIHCCHYPMRVWNKSFDGSFHVCGHTHVDDMRDAREFNAGVDMSIEPYQPRRLDKVLAAMSPRWYPARGSTPLPDGDPSILARFQEDYGRPLDMRALLEEKKAVAETVRRLESSFGTP